MNTENKLKSILDFDVCNRMVQDAINKGENCVILCPHYSINIASKYKYEDGEELQYDLDDLSDHVGYFVSVSDYDDLVIDYLQNEDNDL